MVDRRFTKSRRGTIGPGVAQAGRALAQSWQSWHGAEMEQHSGNASRAGGAIIALTVLVGAIGGASIGQPSLGTVIGTGVGTAIALALYLLDRRGR